MTLRPSQLETLRVVAIVDKFTSRAYGGCGVSEISARLGISGYAAEKRLWRLAEAGLVEIRRLGEPRRGGVIHMCQLTDHGLRILREQEGR